MMDNKSNTNVLLVFVVESVDGDLYLPPLEVLDLDGFVLDGGLEEVAVLPLGDLDLG